MADDYLFFVFNRPEGDMEVFNGRNLLGFSERFKWNG